MFGNITKLSVETALEMLPKELFLEKIFEKFKKPVDKIVNKW